MQSPPQRCTVPLHILQLCLMGEARWVYVQLQKVTILYMKRRQGTLLCEGWKQVRAEQESVTLHTKTCEMLCE